MLIRRMDLLDIDKIVALEQELFSSPWDKEAFYYELEKNAFSTILVLEDELEIIGYIGMWLLGDQTQITTLGIKKAYQGSGYAKKLMDKLGYQTKKQSSCMKNVVSRSWQLERTIIRIIMKMHI